MSSHRLTALATLTLVAASAALAGCPGSDEEQPANKGASASTPAARKTEAAKPQASARKWSHGYPSSIAVLGHSGATGESSDPNQPGVEIRANSWATGSNTEVGSVYLRLLDRNPAIKGHNENYAEAGADVNALAGQADRLLARHAKPALILIQIMDNDLICPVNTGALSSFRRQLTAIVKKLARGAPYSREFVVSQIGSVDTYAKALTREERASQGGSGPCAFMTPTGDIPPRKVARAEKAIHAYEAALKAACGTVRQCTYDGGAVGQIVDRREYYGPDLNHLTIEGHAKLAAAAWAAMRRAHVLRKSN
jgi:lysophospholipase L1-like esterase